MNVRFLHGKTRIWPNHSSRRTKDSSWIYMGKWQTNAINMSDAYHPKVLNCLMIAIKKGAAGMSFWYHFCDSYFIF